MSERVWLLSRPLSDPIEGRIKDLLSRAGEKMTSSPADATIALEPPVDNMYAGLGSGSFLEASRVGQVISRLAGLNLLGSLGWTFVSPSSVGVGLFTYSDGWLVSDKTGWKVVPHDLVLLAAADYDPREAYHGNCPGVDPATFFAWRLHNLSEFCNTTFETMLGRISKAEQVLDFASHIYMCGKQNKCTVADIRKRDVSGVDLDLLAEVAMRQGCGCLFRLEKEKKIVLKGASKQAVKCFAERWAPKNNLFDVWSNPSKGFAGGYYDPS